MDRLTGMMDASVVVGRCMIMNGVVDKMVDEGKGCMDERMDEEIDRWTDVWMMDGQSDGWRNRCTERWMEAWMAVWYDGLMDG